MKLARFNDDRIGVVRVDSIVDVTDIVDGQPGIWPPVAMNRLIANFGEYRGKLAEERHRQHSLRGEIDAAQERRLSARCDWIFRHRKWNGVKLRGHGPIP